MPEDDAIVFAEKLLALLDSGRYTATYKFAVLVALIDECVSSVDEQGRAPDELSAFRIGHRVLELYWPQAVPYRSSAAAAPVVLRQSTQANDLVQVITAYRQAHGFVAGVSLGQAERREPHVRGHEKVPTGGQLRYPLVATGSTRWWPREVPTPH